MGECEIGQVGKAEAALVMAGGLLFPLGICRIAWVGVRLPLVWVGRSVGRPVSRRLSRIVEDLGFVVEALDDGAAGMGTALVIWMESDVSLLRRR